MVLKTLKGPRFPAFLTAAGLALGGTAPARADKEDDGDPWGERTSLEQVLEMPERTWMQLRLSLGSQLEEPRAARPDFPVGGQAPGALEEASKLKPGFAYALDLAILGREGWHGAYLGIVQRRRRLSLGGSGELGDLQSDGAYISPTLGWRFPMGGDWSVRPSLHFGIGYEWTRLDVVDPNLLPAATGNRESPTVEGYAWKAGAGMDLHWRRCCAVTLTLERLGHRPALPILDSATGAQIGLLDADASAWSWRLGLLYGY